MGTISFFSRSKNEYNEYLIPSKKNDDQVILTDKAFCESKVITTTEDPILFYGFILSKISSNKKVLGIPIWDVAQFIHNSGKKHECINWNHNINCQQKIRSKSFTFEDNGFCKAASSEFEPAYPQWCDKADQTALFSINNSKDIYDLLDAVKTDIYGEINLFILERTHKKNELISLLREDKKPSLEAVLKKSDILVDFIFSSDEKFQDCMILKSKCDLSPFLDTVISDFENDENVIDNNFKKIKLQKAIP